MSEASKTLSRPIYEGTSNATSSPALEAGVTPSDWPDGPMTDQSGQAPVLASLSALSERGRDFQIKGIFGRNGYGSYPSCALQSCLESRLLTQKYGSTRCSVTWRNLITPAGRQIFRLLVKAHLTRDPDFGFVADSNAAGWANAEGFSTSEKNAEVRPSFGLVCGDLPQVFQRSFKPDSSWVVDGVRGEGRAVSAFGNAIVPQVAAAFIEAFMETQEGL